MWMCMAVGYTASGVQELFKIAEKSDVRTLSSELS